MARKFFTQTPTWIMGLIFVLGSMLDVVATVQILQKEAIWAIVILAIRAGINKVEVLYKYGLKDNLSPPQTKP